MWRDRRKICMCMNKHPSRYWIIEWYFCILICIWHQYRYMKYLLHSQFVFCISYYAMKLFNSAMRRANECNLANWAIFTWKCFQYWVTRSAFCYWAVGTKHGKSALKFQLPVQIVSHPFSMNIMERNILLHGKYSFLYEASKNVFNLIQRFNYNQYHIKLLAWQNTLKQCSFYIINLVAYVFGHFRSI